MTLHYRNVYGVAGRQQLTILSDLPSAQNLRFLDWKHFVDDVQSQLQRRPDGVTPFK